MVVRDEPDGIRRYTHIGTGNYNPKTSRIYEDLGLITTDEVIGEDVAHLFNNLSGWSRNASYEQLLVAPDNVRSGLVERIHREIAHHRAGHDALIRLKANSVVDEGIIDALYLASQAGVRVELLVRGICALRPGVPGLSENIEVRSILGRFLEHSRVYSFANAGSPEAWIGSADMMHRNLDRRVEVLVRLPHDDDTAAVDTLLADAFGPDSAAWLLGPDGEWTRNAGTVHLQERLIESQRRRR
jgi:polyphosphate kinase